MKKQLPLLLAITISIFACKKEGHKSDELKEEIKPVTDVNKHYTAYQLLIGEHITGMWKLEEVSTMSPYTKFDPKDTVIFAFANNDSVYISSDAKRYPGFVPLGAQLYNFTFLRECQWSGNDKIGSLKIKNLNLGVHYSDSTLVLVHAFGETELYRFKKITPKITGHYKGFIRSIEDGKEIGQRFNTELSLTNTEYRITNGKEYGTYTLAGDKIQFNCNPTIFGPLEVPGPGILCGLFKYTFNGKNLILLIGIQHGDSFEKRYIEYNLVKQ